MANTLVYLPQTPSQTRVISSFDAHRPTKSSPLAPVSFLQTSSPDPVSPVAELQARRKGQFKQGGPSSTSVGSLKHRGRFRRGRADPIPFILGPVTPEAGQKAFLRERFKADCFERARRAREKCIIQRRASGSSDVSSDGLDADMMADDEGNEDDDDTAFDDELFRRVIVNEKRKLAHAYAVSYEIDVGSSFDLDMEDPTSWEEEFFSSPSAPSQLQPWLAREEDEQRPNDDLEDVPDFDEFDLDEESAWVDSYIASLPLGTADAQSSAPSHPRDDQLEHQQMDITMD